MTRLTHAGSAWVLSRRFCLPGQHTHADACPKLVSSQVCSHLLT